MQKKGKKKWIIAGVIIVLVLIAAAKSKITKNAEYKNFTWPDTELAAMLPDPGSRWGKVISDSPTYLTVDVAKISSKEYEKYYKKCSEAGFTVDYYRSDSYYSADNSEGYQLSLSYEGDNKVMNIMLNAPSDLKDPEAIDTKEQEKEENPEENTEETDPSDDNQITTDAEKTETSEADTEKNNKADSAKDSDSSKQSNSNGSVRTEVKDALDSYEKFMNDYVAFMEKYNDSEDTISMLADYTKYMEKYSEMTQKLEEIEEMELNDAENLYYIEVQTRINEKLAELQ